MLIFLICGLFASNIAQAQDELIRGAIGTQFTFNHQDVFWSFGGGLESPQLQASLMADFALRPGRKRVLVEVDNNFFDQYREKRFLLSFGAEKRFTLVENNGNMVQLWAMLRGSYSFGNYAGTSYAPPKGFILNPAGGAAYNFEDGIFRVGYHYLPLKNASITPHRIFIGITGFI